MSNQEQSSSSVGSEQKGVHTSHYQQYKEAHLRYQSSEKGKAARAKYQESSKGKAARKRYQTKRAEWMKILLKEARESGRFQS